MSDTSKPGVFTRAALALGRGMRGLVFRASTTSVSDLVNPRKWLLDFGGRVTTAGENVNPASAMTLPVYYACLRNISEDVAKLPLVLYRRRTPRGKDRATDDPRYALLHDSPNPNMSALAFRECMTHYALGWGGAVAEIVFNGLDQPAQLWPIHPTRVRIAYEDRRLVYKINVSDLARPDTWITLEQNRVFHLHGLGPDGVNGYSVLQLAAESLGLALASQRFGAAFFGNGAQPSGALRHPGKLDEKAIEHLRAFLNEQFGGPGNAHKPAILEEGMEWQQFSVNPKDAQFLEGRSFAIEEVARWCRMPPHKVGHLARATFSNIEHQSLEYVTDTLMPWLVRWEQEAARKLLTLEERKTHLFEHVVQALLRGDQAARATYYQQMLNIGALSPNDIRDLENMNPIGPEGDHYFMQSAMATLERIVNPPTPPPPMLPAGGPPGEPKPAAPEDDPEPEEAPEDTPEEAQARAERFALVVAKQYAPICNAAAERVVAKERSATTRAFTKHAKDTGALNTWALGFYAEQVSYLIECVMPIARSVEAAAEGACASFKYDDALLGSLASRARALFDPRTRLSDVASKTERALVTDLSTLVLSVLHDNIKPTTGAKP